MRALVVRFSAIGDCVMASPVAASIRRKDSAAHIVWAVEPRCSPVIETETLVNRLAMFPRDDWEQRRWSPATWLDQLRTYLGLRKERFDLGIDLQGQSKTALCLALAKPPKRIAVRGHDALSKRLNPILDVPRGDMHSVEHGLLALTRLGDFSTEAQFVMPRLNDERKAVASMLPSGKRLATISVSAGNAKKTYPLERWEEIARHLMSKGLAVAFLGGPGDPPASVPGTVDLVGKLALAQTMAAVAMSDLHLAADTGTGHMAAAYKVPVVSVFGQTRPSVFRPYTDRGIVLDGAGSTLNVTTEQVIEAATSLLERKHEAVSS